MYTLHIANKNYSSWSLRPWVLMRAQDIAFEEQQWTFGDGSNLDRFRVFSPSGRVPCLHHDGCVVWDSLAIVEYLAERHCGVWPGDVRARAWARSAAAEMHSGFTALRSACGMNCGVRVRLHEYSPGLRADLVRLEALWSDGLERFGGDWLAGASFTAVDAFFAPVAFRIQTYGLELGNPAASYAERLLQLPAMREWYEAALAEPVRDAGHEAELLASGTVLEDLRVPA